LCKNTNTEYSGHFLDDNGYDSFKYRSALTTVGLWCMVIHV
jgi:hypothetical protein